jgi:glucose-6-phosphate 1-dehydrogenase
VLKAVRRWNVEDCERVVVLGQYEGYLDEDNVAPDSTTETFAAMELHVDDWRWADVPFYLRTGKRLPEKTTEIAVQYKRVPHLLFDKTEVEDIAPNVLVIRVQPDEGISMFFAAKVPGPQVNIRTVDMEFDYETDFGSGTPEAYERLLLDCMLGEQMLFTRSDEIEEQWEIVDPILEHCSRIGRPARYEPGTWGPPGSAELLATYGHSWRTG